MMLAPDRQGYSIDDPDAVLKMNFVGQSEANFTKYCNPEVERLLDQQSQEADPGGARHGSGRSSAGWCRTCPDRSSTSKNTQPAGTRMSKVTSSRRTQSIITPVSSRFGSIDDSGHRPCDGSLRQVDRRLACRPSFETMTRDGVMIGEHDALHPLLWR